MLTYTGIHTRIYLRYFALLTRGYWLLTLLKQHFEILGVQYASGIAQKPLGYTTPLLLSFVCLAFQRHTFKIKWLVSKPRQPQKVSGQDPAYTRVPATIRHVIFQTDGRMRAISHWHSDPRDHTGNRGRGMSAGITPLAQLWLYGDRYFSCRSGHTDKRSDDSRFNFWRKNARSSHFSVSFVGKNHGGGKLINLL